MRFRCLSIVLVLLFSGCETTRESVPVRHAGFLTHPERIGREGSTDHRSWNDPDFDLTEFDAVWIPAVSLVLDEGTETDLGQQDINRLAALFRASVRAKMEVEGWRIVEEPGERVLAIHLALSELEPADPVANVVTATAPYLAEAVQVLAVAADVHVFVGKVSTEVRVEDSASGQVLAEGIDRRVGAQSVANMGTTWGDVKDAMDVWSDRIAIGLTKVGNPGG